jgi:hypothetical protein
MPGHSGKSSSGGPAETGGDPEVVDQLLAQLGRRPRVELEPHDVAEAPPAQLGLHRLQEVVGLVVDLEVGVARHAERRGLLDLHSGEERSQVCGDQLLERQVATAVPDRPEARQHLGHLDAREAAIAGERIAYEHAEREREVRDVGERPSWPDGERRQHGEDHAQEGGGELGALAVVAVGERDDLHAAARELGHQLLEDAALLVHEPVGALGDLVEHLGERELTRCRPPPGACAGVLEQPGDPHHVELVEVGREDRQVAHPLEQRHLLVARELEHAAVELDPGELAVEQSRLLARGASARTRDARAARHQPAFAIRRSARGRSSQRSSPVGRSIRATPPLGIATWAPARSCTSAEKSGS